MRVKDITSYLESIAPLSYQESYDNAGLIVGDPNAEVTAVLICLDSIESIIDEAIERGCQLVIAHHPIVFSGIKKFNGKNYVERVVMKAIKNDIAIYAAHTNLDNVQNGVNAKICEKLGLTNTRILSPKKNTLRKLVVFCPTADADNIRMALHDAGAGRIGDYDQCSFNLLGKGTFRAGENSDPVVGEVGKQHTEEEMRIEVVYRTPAERQIIGALMKVHPYEEVPYDIYALNNKDAQIGSGMVGELAEPMEEQQFLAQLKEQMGAGCVRYTDLLNKPVKTVAVCGGAGSFLLGAARGAGADVFVTADYKYHEFFDAEGRIVIADIGHYESEQFTSELFRDFLTKKFPNFAFHLTEVNTNPVNYI
jgi:dinuclear metal center YbgI/SA1388 family protein